MHIGQRVYIKTHEYDLKWYKGTIKHIRRKKRHRKYMPLYALVDCITCWKFRPIEYVVELKNQSRLVVLKNCIQTHL